MATLNREQLIQYIKGLEQKVKSYQTVLKDRDGEINELKKKIEAFETQEAPAAPPPAPPSPAPPAAAIPPAATNKPPDNVPPPLRKFFQAPAEPPKMFVKPAALVAGAPTPTAPPPATPFFQASSFSATPFSPSSPPAAPFTPASVPPASPSYTTPPPAAPVAPVIVAPVGGETLSEPGGPDMMGETTKADVSTAAAQELNAAEAKTPVKASANFKAGAFLSAVLEGEEEADEVKGWLEALSKAEKGDRRNILLSLTRTHWQMVVKMAKRMAKMNLSWEKRLFMRYGMLDESLMADQSDLWQRLCQDKSRPENSGMYFIDEWFEEVARGNIKYSTIDEMSLDGEKPDPNPSPELALHYETISIPQMQRVCVGPRANLVSVLTRDYCHPSRDNPVVDRPWLKAALDYVLKRDYQIFARKYKGQEFTVSPTFILCPGYGEGGFNWEPYSPGQKSKTGPRNCLCIFPPKNTLRALILGLADYRWEYAKADAMHYWLTEGLTGKWYGMFSIKQQRKNLKGFFLECYYEWIVNESQMLPRIDRRLREFFWYNIPFGDEIKQALKGGGLFGHLIEMEEEKKKRDEAERIAFEKIKAEREARRAARKAKLEG